MPFDQFIPRSLSAASVRTNAPAASGVYGISNAREWIYIGETDDIQASLLDHLQEADSAVMKRRPTGFVFEMCSSAGRPARRDRLVFEYEPTCSGLPQRRRAYD